VVAFLTLTQRANVDADLPAIYITTRPTASVLLLHTHTSIPLLNPPLPI
jgi:hypothetical protein